MRAISAGKSTSKSAVPDEHPILKDAGFARHHLRTPAEMLMEEPYDWCRPLTDEECTNPYLVVVDLNMSFSAAANGLTVGLNGPTHLTGNPAFDPALPGSWLVDLSHVDLSRVWINGRTVDGTPAALPVHAEGRPARGPGLVRHADRAVRGGAGLRRRADRPDVLPRQQLPCPRPGSGVHRCGAARHRAVGLLAQSAWFPALELPGTRRFA